MYKSSIKYIMLFLVLCLVVSWISSITDNAIKEWYIIDINLELHEVFLVNDDFNIDGLLLAVYLYDTSEPFILNGNYYDYFSTEQYNEFKGRSYKVDTLEHDYLNIVEDYKGDNIRLKSIKDIDKAILIRKITTNIVTIALGVLLLYIYTKNNSNISKDKDKEYREIPVV